MGARSRPRNLNQVALLLSIRARALTLLIAGLVMLAGTSALAPSAARADGDPASDVLLGESVYYPYSPPVSAATTKALNATMTAAAKAGFNLKVALIAAPTDLGVIPDLFAKPQKYADFLDQEISFTNRRQPLLVVMQAGYGVQGVSPAVAAAAAALPKPSGASSEALAQAALAAVPKLAAADGHKLGAVSVASASRSSGGSGTNVALLIVLILCALAAAGALVALRQRSGRSTEVR